MNSEPKICTRCGKTLSQAGWETPSMYKQRKNCPRSFAKPSRACKRVKITKPRHRLSDTAVREIRRDAHLYTRKALSEIYGVGVQSISDAINRETYRYINYRDGVNLD